MLISTPTVFSKEALSIEIFFPTKSPRSHDNLRATTTIIENYGFRVNVFPENAFCEPKSPFGYYANSLEARTQAFIQAINGSSKILWAYTGGFGCVEIVERLEAMNFKPSSFPKILVGFSDITHLHALWAKWNWPSLHGPNAGSIVEPVLSSPAPDTLRKDSFYKTLSYLSHPFTTLTYTFQWLNAPPSTHPSLSLSAPLYGGNATLVKEMDSTPTELPLSKTFLFLEESPESRKRMNRVLTSLLRSQKLSSLSGLLFGYIPDPSQEDLPETLRVFLKDHLNRTSAPYPILYNPDFGHGPRNLPLPFGVKGTLSFADGRGILTFPRNFGAPTLT